MKVVSQAVITITMSGAEFEKLKSLIKFGYETAPNNASQKDYQTMLSQLGKVVSEKQDDQS
jgi:hypothetical protein